MKFSIISLVLAVLPTLSFGLTSSFLQTDLVPLAAKVVPASCTTVSTCNQHITAHSHLICKDHQCRSKCNTGFMATAKGKCHVIVCDPAKCTQPIPKKSTHTCLDNKCSYTCDPDHHFNGVSCVASSCAKGITHCHQPVPHHSTATCTKNVCSFTCNAGYERSGNFCKQIPMHCTSASQCLITAGTDATVYCTGGNCGVACNAGYQESTDKTTCVPNPTHCGKNQCHKLSHGQIKCPHGVCSYSCNAEAGYTLEGTATSTTAACYNYNKDAKNCGSFGNVCPASAPTCSKGVCVHAHMRRQVV